MAVMEAAVAPARLRDERIASCARGKAPAPMGAAEAGPFGKARKPPTIANAIAADLKIRMVLLLLARIAWPARNAPRGKSPSTAPSRTIRGRS